MAVDLGQRSLVGPLYDGSIIERREVSASGGDHQGCPASAALSIRICAGFQERLQHGCISSSAPFINSVASRIRPYLADVWIGTRIQQCLNQFRMSPSGGFEYW